MSSKDIPEPDQWVELYGDYLYRYALMRLRNTHAAEDVVQETLLAGVKGMDSFDGRVNIKYWLRGILRNKVVDYIRKAVREQPIDESEDAEIMDRLLMKTSGIPTMRPQPWTFDPREQFNRKEFWTVFQSCQEKLKDPMRQAFVLKMLEGMKSEEICKVMDISPNYLWVLMHRAREQMKACLEKNWKQEER